MKRWQDPPIEKRRDVPRPYYFIRPYVPRAGAAGLQRVQKRIPLGFVDETTMRRAQARKQEIMAPINQGKFILQAQIQFAAMVEKYREARLPKLGAATRNKYETHLKNHILPVFGRAEMADIDRQSIEAWLNREAGPHSHEVAGVNILERRERTALRPEMQRTSSLGALAKHESATGQIETVKGRDAGDKYNGLGWWALSDLRNILSAIFSAATDWACGRARIRALASTWARSRSGGRSASPALWICSGSWRRCRIPACCR